MPIGWIQPDLFLRHQGVAVYHVYRNDEYEQGPREYWFTTDKYGGDYNDPCSFDVRELSTFAADKPHDKIIREAIEAGVLPLEESDCEDGCEDPPVDVRNISRDQMARLLTVLRDNGIAPDEAATVAEAICYVLDLPFEEADLDGEIIP